MRSMGSARKRSAGSAGASVAERADVADRVGIAVDALTSNPRAACRRIASAAAPRVEDAIALGDPAAQELIEEINVNRAEGGVEIHPKSLPAIYSSRSDDRMNPRSSPIWLRSASRNCRPLM